MRTLPINVRTWLERVQINTRNRINRVDRRKRIGAATFCCPRRQSDVGNVRRHLHNDWRPRLLLYPRSNLLAVLRNLSHSGSHPSLTHPMRTSEVEFQSVS